MSGRLMFTWVASLIVLAALFTSFIQTLCEQVPNREFRRAYRQGIRSPLGLELSRVRQAVATGGFMNLLPIRLAQQSDYFTFESPARNSNPEYRPFLWEKKIDHCSHALVPLVVAGLLRFPLPPTASCRETDGRPPRHCEPGWRKACSVSISGCRPDPLGLGRKKN